MRNELPSLESAGKARRETPPSPAENAKNSKVIETKETKDEIKNLADKVSEIMEKMKKIPEYKKMSYPLRRDKAIRSCLGISGFRILTEKEEQLKADIISELSSRGASVTNKKKENKRMHTVPKRKVFTPAQIKSMIEQSEKLQEKDEERAGQSWEDTDLEK